MPMYLLSLSAGMLTFRVSQARKQPKSWRRSRRRRRRRESFSGGKLDFAIKKKMSTNNLMRLKPPEKFSTFSFGQILKISLNKVGLISSQCRSSRIVIILQKMTFVMWTMGKYLNLIKIKKTQGNVGGNQKKNTFSHL